MRRKEAELSGSTVEAMDTFVRGLEDITLVNRDASSATDQKAGFLQLEQRRDFTGDERVLMHGAIVSLHELDVATRDLREEFVPQRRYQLSLSR